MGLPPSASPHLSWLPVFYQLNLLGLDAVGKIAAVSFVPAEPEAVVCHADNALYKCHV